jgi:hypothetical protein
MGSRSLWLWECVSLISAIKKKTFKGPVVHNKSLEDHIQGFKGPKDASDQALTNINAWLDETDTLWTMLQAYPECLATEGQRWTELLRQMKVWSVSDSNKFPTDIFINDMRARATSTGVKSLSDLITSFSTWIEAEILERQASKSNKVISANATTPSGRGCAKHGPNAKHTTAECKGLMKRPQGQQSQRTNGKAPFNGRPRFNSDKVHFNQDREAAGNRMQWFLINSLYSDTFPSTTHWVCACCWDARLEAGSFGSNICCVPCFGLRRIPLGHSGGRPDVYIHTVPCCLAGRGGWLPQDSARSKPGYEGQSIQSQTFHPFAFRPGLLSPSSSSRLP